MLEWKHLESSGRMERGISSRSLPRLASVTGFLRCPYGHENLDTFYDCCHMRFPDRVDAPTGERIRSRRNAIDQQDGRPRYLTGGSDAGADGATRSSPVIGKRWGNRSGILQWWFGAADWKGSLCAVRSF